MPTPTTLIKVFYVSDMREGPLVFGTTDGTRTEGGLYINVDGQPILSAFVFLDTPENHNLLKAYRAAYATWKAAEPNVYEMSNAAKRP